ncbi:MAG TPA: triose-phosphate isomerase, partial [Myxococcota bacterium]|nr:triose-phosphate isomerase [Myxococcota bacterium]
MRKPILAANWKMHKTQGEAMQFVAAFLPLVKDATAVEILLAPAFPALARVGEALSGSNVLLAAQNVNPELQGAFTGEVSPAMLADVGCRYAIVGHSERRSLYGEDDGFVARKARALLERGIRPIVCVGETLAEREAGRTFGVVGGQLEGSLREVPSERAAEVVVAYEPVWAIGTGRTATPALAQEVHAFVRERLTARFGAAAQAMRIQYGGSVKPENVDDLMAQPDIDGALVGGASLDPEAFARIVRFRPGSG